MNCSIDNTSTEKPTPPTTEPTTTEPTLTKNYYQYNCLAQSTDITGEGNFPQGCQFSPDGLCVLTATAADATLRLYNLVTGAEAGAGSGIGSEEARLQTKEATTEAKTTTTAIPQPWTCALRSSVVGEVVRSYDWYPRMQSSNPATCLFAATGRDQPVQLIDAYTGNIRATYAPVNEREEMESPATVVQFSPNGDQIITAGYKSERMLVVFDTGIPGRGGTVVKLGHTKRSKDGQKGMISALACSKESSSISSGSSPLIAVGTYAPGSIYVYDYRQKSHSGVIWNDGCCIVGHGNKHKHKCARGKKRRLVHNTTDDNHHDDHDNDNNIFSFAKAKWYAQRVHRGITQLEFNSHYMLYSASRNSDAVLVWDLRMMSGIEDFQTNPIGGYANYPTNAYTNQRLQFCLDEPSQRLWVGGCDGRLLVYDTSTSSNDNPPLQSIKDIPGCIPGDAVNGISYQPTYDMLAVATGSRRFPPIETYDSDSDSGTGNGNEAKTTTGPPPPVPGSLLLYKVNNTYSTTDNINAHNEMER